jgi:hypothetical protein
MSEHKTDNDKPTPPQLVIHETPTKLLLTVEEVGFAMGVARSSVLKLFDLGRRGDPEGLRVVRVGRRILCPVSEIRRWVEYQLAAFDDAA